MHLFAQEKEPEISKAVTEEEVAELENSGWGVSAIKKQKAEHAIEGFALSLKGAIRMKKFLHQHRCKKVAKSKWRRVSAVIKEVHVVNTKFGMQPASPGGTTSWIDSNYLEVSNELARSHLTDNTFKQLWVETRVSGKCGVCGVCGVQCGAVV